MAAEDEHTVGLDVELVEGVGPVVERPIESLDDVRRLRGKLRYRPVIFELMPAEFTLLRLQRAVEAVIGAPLHKQNFRRGLERTGLVEGLGRMDTASGGRPSWCKRKWGSCRPTRPRLPAGSCTTRIENGRPVCAGWTR